MSPYTDEDNRRDMERLRKLKQTPGAHTGAWQDQANQGIAQVDKILADPNIPPSTRRELEKARRAYQEYGGTSSKLPSDPSTGGTSLPDTINEAAQTAMTGIAIAAQMYQQRKAMKEAEQRKLEAERRRLEAIHKERVKAFQNVMAQHDEVSLDTLQELLGFDTLGNTVSFLMTEPYPGAMIIKNRYVKNPFTIVSEKERLREAIGATKETGISMPHDDSGEKERSEAEEAGIRQMEQALKQKLRTYIISGIEFNLHFKVSDPDIQKLLDQKLEAVFVPRPMTYDTLFSIERNFVATGDKIIQEIIDHGTPLDKKIYKAITGKLGEVVDSVKEMISDTVDSITKPIREPIDKIEQKFDDIVDDEE